MKFSEFKSKHFIVDERLCMGDVWSNERLMWFETVKDAPYIEPVLDYVDKVLTQKEDRWIVRAFNKQEIQKLITMANSKSLKTYLKRVNSMLNYLNKPMYAFAVNKVQFDNFKILTDA